MYNNVIDIHIRIYTILMFDLKMMKLERIYEMKYTF